MKKAETEQSNAAVPFYNKALKILKTDIDEETRGELLRSIFCVASSHITSSLKRPMVVKCLLEVMQYTPLPTVLPFAEALMRHPMEPTITQQYSSEFVQAFVLNIPRFCVESYGYEIFRLQAVFDKLFTYLIRHFQAAVQDRHASLVARAILSALGGITKVNPSDDADPKYPPLPDNWKVFDKLGIFASEMIKLDFEKAISDPVVCPVITAFLYASSRLQPCLIGEVAVFFKNIIYTQEKFDALLREKCSSFFLQCLVECDPKIRRHVLHKFASRSVNSQNVDITNSVLHSTISSISSCKEMVTAGSEIIDFNILLTCSRLRTMKVIVAITEMFVQYAFKIETLIENLIMLSYCGEPEESRKNFLRCLLAWKVHADLVNKLHSINLTGALITKELFQSLTYSEPVRESLLNLSGPELVQICCNSIGSFAIQVLFSGPIFSKKGVLCAFTDKVLPHVVQLATDKHGSYVLAKLWDANELKYRTLIAEQLCNNEKKVLSHPSGKFLSDRFQLKDFKNRRQKWMDGQCSHIKKQIMLGKLATKDSDEQLKNENDNKPHVVQLATNKHSSYVSTKLWDANDLKYRMLIAQELCNNKKKLLSHPSGKFLSDLFHLKDFKNEHRNSTDNVCSHIEKEITPAKLATKDSDEQLKNQNDSKTTEGMQPGEETDDTSKLSPSESGKS